MTTLTARDIADLARVQRPTVAYWRKRTQVRGEPVPFPQAVDVREGVEHFDRDDIVAWLSRTGRGNNADFAADAAAVALPTGADLSELTSLLLLRSLAGREVGGLEPDDLVDLADELDPDDAFLMSEIEELGDRGPDLLAYVDDLVGASYGYADAYDRLSGGRLKRESLPAPFATALHGLAAQVLVSLAGALGDGTALTVADASEGRALLAVSAVRALPESVAGGLVVSGETPPARQQRRVAALLGLTATESPGVGSVAVLPVVGLAAGEALDAIDRLQLDTTAGRLAVVVGPVALLCDRLRDERLDGIRAEILRSDHLRYAARLPKGLWLPGPRMSLGLWVFGPAPSRRIEDRTIVLSDLTEVELDPGTIESVAEDVLAAVSNVSGHAFAHGRVVRTAAVVASGPVVPSGTRPVRLRPTTPTVVSLQEELVRLGRSVTPAAVSLELEPATAPRLPMVTLGDLVSSGDVRLLPGARLLLEAATPSGAVRVADPGSRISVGFDPIELEHRHPGAQRTEPGDVVFTTTPQPRAVVDDAGGCVVPFPARILRPRSDRANGHLIAAVVNSQPPDAREWRIWRIPSIDPERLADLAEALARMDRERTLLEQQSERLRALAQDLIDAVASGAVSVVPDHQTEGV